MGHEVEHLYVWLTLDADGDETMPAFMAPDGTLMPMVASDPARLASLKPIAEALANQHDQPITLYRFDTRIELETYTKDPT